MSNLLQNFAHFSREFIKIKGLGEKLQPFVEDKIPVPSSFVVKKGSNTCFCTCSSMPMPVSLIQISTYSPGWTLGCWRQKDLFSMTFSVSIINSPPSGIERMIFCNSGQTAFGMAENTSEHIIEIMRNTANELPEALHFLCVEILLL